MTPSGVQVSVIVSEGNEDRSPSLEGSFGRTSTDDCPRRQAPPPCVATRRIGRHDRQRQRVPRTVTKRRFRFAALSLTIRETKGLPLRLIYDAYAPVEFEETLNEVRRTRLI